MSKASVSFAPTTAFVKAFGEEEAAEQKRKFESKRNPLLVDEQSTDRDAFVGIAFVAGIVVGAAIGVTIVKLC